MSIKLWALLGVIIMGVSGCTTQIPVAESYSLTTQKKIRAPHHWEIIAHDVATQTRQALDSKPDILQGRSLYVHPSPQDNTEFGRAFKNFITTSLINHGIPMTDSEFGAISVKYETQVVQHYSTRKYSPLESTITVARNIPQDDRSADYGSTATVITDGPTNTELIVTSSVIADNQYLMGKSDVYYFDGMDIRLFAKMVPAPPAVKEMEVVGQ